MGNLADRDADRWLFIHRWTHCDDPGYRLQVNTAQLPFVVTCLGFGLKQDRSPNKYLCRLVPSGFLSIQLGFSHLQIPFH